MLSRCYRPQDISHRYYGPLGVAVYEPWRHDFAAFLADVGPRPSSKHSIDRWPNPSGNYEPGNVRWATAKEQANNRRNSKHNKDLP